MEALPLGWLLGHVFGAEFAIRPDSLQRAGALGLLHRLLAMDVVDAESLDDCAEVEDKTRRKWTDRAFNKDITERDGCDTLWMTRDSFYFEPMWCAHTITPITLLSLLHCDVYQSVEVDILEDDSLE